MTPETSLPSDPPVWPAPTVANHSKEDHWRDEIVEPDLGPLPTEDDTPLDNFFQAKQQRLLVEPLRSFWLGPNNDGKYLVDANVGIYASSRDPAIVPDFFLSLDVTIGDDYRLKENRSYFAWLFGKFPDLALEIVSNDDGGEDTDKLRKYARMGVPYYVIFDPFQILSADVLRIFVRSGNKYRRTSETWIEEIGLGLCLWTGTFEGQILTWLRWCDRNGVVIPTGAERTNRSGNAPMRSGNAPISWRLV